VCLLENLAGSVQQIATWDELKDGFAVWRTSYLPFRKTGKSANEGI
jgi:hypothetical protein